MSVGEIWFCGVTFGVGLLSIGLALVAMKSATKSLSEAKDFYDKTVADTKRQVDGWRSECFEFTEETTVEITEDTESKR